MTAPTPRETADHAELIAGLKTNDPTNPAHRLAKDLQAGHRLGTEAGNDLIEVLSEIAALRGERRNIVSHATMGTTDGEGLTVNGVSVEITRLRNAMHSSYHTRLTHAERQRDELRKALERISGLCPATCETSLAHDMADIASQALASHGADQ